MLKPRVLLADLKVKEVIYKCKSTWFFVKEQQEENWEQIAKRFRKTKNTKLITLMAIQGGILANRLFKRNFLLTHSMINLLTWTGNNYE